MEIMTKTYLEKPADVKRKWFLVDAEGKTLGRLAAKVASVLRGKHKPTFTPHVDTGDHVVIVNAEKVRLTGNKMENKTYSYHTGYPGGLKTLTAEHIHKKQPTELLTRAIKGMLPKTPLGNHMAKKLRVYAGATHPHQAQQLEPLSL
ncbi:MAG: 50S ribosomal protein L13 [Nitrospirae bacterium]|nr:MAG: 50S ribosomal protein L13 [Nitrospira sp. OLB3]MBV6469267.1 50S ribosomal protein L13 [Nitrospirota bacterium]